MRDPKPFLRASLALLLSALAAGQDDPAPKPRMERYSPPTHTFYCDVPVGWKAFEESDAGGPIVHIIGPEEPAAQFRAGIDVRLSEKGDPTYEPYKKALEEMRRSDERVVRTATTVRVMRISGALARFFEITETRRLPEGGWPGAKTELHRYVAVYPSGESYYTISLASSRDAYLDYRDIFLEFLKGFKPLGYK